MLDRAVQRFSWRERFACDSRRAQDTLSAMQPPDRRDAEESIRRFYARDGWKGHFAIDRVLALRLLQTDTENYVAHVSYTFVAKTDWARQTSGDTGADARTFQLQWRDGHWIVTSMGEHLSAAGQFETSTVVERQVIERQIVVARCRYCQDLTPVDASHCQNCGAITR